MDFPPRKRTRPARGDSPMRVPREFDDADWVERDHRAEPVYGDGYAADLAQEPEIPAFAQTDEVEAIPGSRDDPPRARSETLMRLLWAIPLGIAAITVVAIGGGVFAAAMALLAAAGLTELFAMAARARPFQLVAIAASTAMIVAAHFGDSFHILLAGVAFFPLMFFFIVRRESLHGVTWSVAITVFGLIWISLPFAHAVLLRDLPLHGGALLVNVLIATFAGDTFSYIGGRMFGQRPLALTISPNKTIEGLAVGFIGATLGFWFAGLYQDWLSGTDALLMGLAIATLAPIGDLFESALKRDLDVKDSGRIFGPHGGVLDRLDGVFFTVVAGYYLSVAIVY